MSLSSIISFYRNHPALFFSLATLYGFWASLSPGVPFLISFILFLSPFVKQLKALKLIGLWLLLFSICFLFSEYTFKIPTLTPSETLNGIAQFEVNEIGVSRFGSHKLCRGTLLFFQDENRKLQAKNIPCTLSLPFKNEISEGHKIELQGTLLFKNNKFQLQHLKASPFTLIEKKFSLAPFRQKVKEALSNWIKEKLQKPKASLFMIGMATGRFKEEELLFSFGRFGLQHILAISGFHFGLLGAFLLFLLKFILPIRSRAPLLIFLMVAYFIFLGPSPSIIRSFLMIMAATAAMMIGRLQNSINALGASLGAVLIWDPFSLFSMGFIFSFAITLAILLFTPLIDEKLEKIFQKRNGAELSKLTFIQRNAGRAVFFIRKLISLSFSINLVSIPLTLALTGTFPWLSLIYNLYIPLLVSLALFSFLFISLFSLFVSYANSLFLWNGAFIEWILSLSLSSPKKFDFILNFELGASLTSLILTSLFLIGILFPTKKESSPIFY